MLTLTIDLEDHTGLYKAEGRWLANTRRLLAFCAQTKIRATFFAVGQVAAMPGLLRALVADGHELALHSYEHTRLDAEDAATYRGKLLAAKQRFEAITGVAVQGFRAPVFSLNAQSAWVVADLAALGFAYSSSIIAGRGVMGGFAGAPATPFKWKNGLVELPVPVVRFKGWALPFLGGVYLRYLPLGLVRHWQRQMPQQALLWAYAHPYDGDAEEGFTRLDDGTPLWANILLMHHRHGFLAKLASLLQGQAAAPLLERVNAPGWRESLPSWDIPQLP